MNGPQRRRGQPPSQPPSHPYPIHSSFQSNSVPISIPPHSIDQDSSFSQDLSFNHSLQQGQGAEQEDQDSSRIDYTISKPLTKAQQQLRYNAGYPDVRDQIGMVDGANANANGMTNGNGNPRRHGPSSSARRGGGETTTTTTAAAAAAAAAPSSRNHPSQPQRHDDFDQDQSVDDDDDDEDDESTIHQEPSYNPGMARANRMATNSLGSNQVHSHHHPHPPAGSLLNLSSNKSTSSHAFQSKGGRGERLGEMPRDRYSSRLDPIRTQRGQTLDLEPSDSDHFNDYHNGPPPSSSSSIRDSTSNQLKRAGGSIQNSIKADPYPSRVNPAGSNHFKVIRPSPLNHSLKPNLSNSNSNFDSDPNPNPNPNPNTSQVSHFSSSPSSPDKPSNPPIVGSNFIQSSTPYPAGLIRKSNLNFGLGKISSDFASSSSSSCTSSSSSSQTSSSESDSNCNDHSQESQFRNRRLNRNDSTGVHQALAATPTASHGNSNERNPRSYFSSPLKKHVNEARKTKRPTLRKHDLTTRDFDRTEELIEKMERATDQHGGGRDERQVEQEREFDFPRASSNINLRGNPNSNLDVNSNGSKSQSQKKVSSNSESFTAMMKNLREDLPFERRFSAGRNDEARERDGDGQQEEREQEGLEEERGSNSNSNESGFAPGSHYSSSHKTKVDSPSPPASPIPASSMARGRNFGSKFAKNGNGDVRSDFNPVQSESEFEREEFEKLYLPSGISMGNGRSKNKGEILLPDLSGISSCLESPIKEKLGVKHRGIDKEVGRTLNVRLNSSNHRQYHQQGQGGGGRDSGDDDQAAIPSSDPVSISTTLSARAKEFRELISILQDFQSQLQNNDARIEELEQFKTHGWNEQLNALQDEMRLWFQARLQELGLDAKAQRQEEERRGFNPHQLHHVNQNDQGLEDETFTVENHRDRDQDGNQVYQSQWQSQEQDQEQDQGGDQGGDQSAEQDEEQDEDGEEISDLKNNLLKLKTDLENSFDLLNGLQERRRREDEFQRQEEREKQKERERARERERFHSNHRSRGSNIKRSSEARNERVAHVSVTEDEGEVEDEDYREDEENEETREQLIRIQLQMESFEKELKKLNRLVQKDHLHEKVSNERNPIGKEQRMMQTKSSKKIPSTRSNPKPLSGFKSSSRKAHVTEANSDDSQTQSAQSESESGSGIDLGQLKPSEMEKIFIRPNSSASAAKIAAALGSKKKRFNRHLANDVNNPPSSPFRRSTGSVSISDASSNRDQDDENDSSSNHGHTVNPREGRRRVASHEEVRNQNFDRDDEDGDGDTTRSNSHIGPAREPFIHQFKNSRVNKNDQGRINGYVQSSPTKPSASKRSSNGKKVDGNRIFIKNQTTRREIPTQVPVSTNSNLLTPPQSPILDHRNSLHGDSQEESDFFQEEDQGHQVGVLNHQDLTREIDSRVQRAEATAERSQKERKVRERNHHHHHHPHPHPHRLDSNHSKKSCSVCCKEIKSQKKKQERKERIKEMERNKRIEDEEEERILNLLTLNQDRDQDQEEVEEESLSSNKKTRGKAAAAASCSNSSQLKVSLNQYQVDLLKRIIDEHLDEFFHQRQLYSQLADDFKQIDPQMPMIKRRIFASHLLDSVESLEFKANRINQLQELLENSFNDQSRDHHDHDEEDEADDLDSDLDLDLDGHDGDGEDESSGSNHEEEIREINPRTRAKSPSKRYPSEKALGKQRETKQGKTSREDKDRNLSVSAMRNSPPMNDISEPQIQPRPRPYSNQNSGRIRPAIV